MKRLVLFSGMGGDRRLMEPIRIPEVEIVTPDHLPPSPGEDLPRYAARVAASHGVGEADFVGGASFGGMLAAEISRQTRVSGLILLGSCLDPSRLPASYRWLEFFGRFVPDFVLGLRSRRSIIRRRFAPITPEGEEVLIAMASVCPPFQIRAFGRMLLRWSGVPRPSCPVLSIHGSRDAVIPIGAADPHLVLDAGHALTLTHAAQASEAIAAFLARL